MGNLSQLGELSRTFFSRRHIFQLLMWPAFCVAASAMLWGLVFSKLDADRNRIEGNMLNQASALSKAVATTLSLSVLHIDNLSQSLQSRWEHSGDLSNLNELTTNSALNRQWLTFVGIVDGQGRVNVSSAASASLPNLAGEDYFRFHRSDPGRSLRIGRKPVSAVTGQPAIEFTRRLDHADGSFRGVVMVSVRPAYLTSFYDERTFGKRGYLGIRGARGDLYAASLGGVEVFKPLLRVPPPTASGGARWLSNGDWLNNDEKGLVAWEPITPYPLLVVIGLAEQEALLQYSVMADTYIQGAVAASWFLFVCGVTGTVVTMLLIWRKQQAQQTRDAYRLATESAKEGFFFLRALYASTGEIIDFVIEDSNQTGAAIGGVTREQVIGIRLSALSNITDLVVPADLPSQIAIFGQAMAAGIYQDEWTAASVSSFRGLCLERKMVRFGNGLALTVRDISAAKAHERHLVTMAHEDALTKLPNRHWLMHFLPEAIERAKHNGVQLALFFIDIDNFKHVNDTLGHAAGDALLHVAAMRLKSELRPGDSLARLGGDEFTIVLEHIDTPLEAQFVAERIVVNLRR